MRQRVAAFLVVFLLMFYARIFAQEKFVRKSTVNQGPYLNSGNTLGWKFNHPVPEYLIKEDFVKTELKASNYFLLKPLPPDFYSKNSGIVCKKELQFQKTTSIPLRVRLGSLDYVNYLEQKPNAVKPGF